MGATASKDGEEQDRRIHTHTYTTEELLAAEKARSGGAGVGQGTLTASAAHLLAAVEADHGPEDLAVADVQRAVPALHPHEARALRNWLVSKGKAAAAASDSASRERLMLQLQDVERQLDEIMQGVNAEANPEMGHLPNASRSALKNWVTVKRSLLLTQLERVEKVSDSSTGSAGATDGVAGESGAALVVGSIVDEVMMTEVDPEDDLDDGDEENADDDGDDDEHDGTRMSEPEPELETTPAAGPSTPGGDSAAILATNTPSSARRRTLRSSASRTAILETPTDDPTHVGVQITPPSTASQSGTCDDMRLTALVGDSSPSSAASVVASLGSRDLVRGTSSPAYSPTGSLDNSLTSDSSMLARSVSARGETEHSRRRRRLVTGVTFKPGKERELFHGELGLSAGAEVMAKEVAAERLLDEEQAQLADILRQNQSLLGKLKPAAVVAIAKESRMVDVPAGQSVFRQGDHGDEAYAVLKGSCVADISVRLNHRRQQEPPDSPVVDKNKQQHFGVGTVFGEVAVLIRCERAHSVHASPDGPARLAVIDRDMFRAVNEYYTTETRKQLDALLSKVPFLVNLRPSDRSRITAIMDIIHFEPGDVIIHANQQAPSMYMVYEGKAIVRSVTESGQSQDIDVLEKGGYCGHHTLLQDADSSNSSAADRCTPRRGRGVSMTSAVSTGHGLRQGTGEPNFVIAETACTCAHFSILEFKRRFGNVISGVGSTARALMTHQAGGKAMRSSSTIGSASTSGHCTALKPLAELPEPSVAEEDEEDHEDDVWSDTPAADAEEGIPEGGSHEDSKASDELSPEPAGLESDFRFNLNDMKVDKILGRGSFATVNMGSISGQQAAIKCMRKVRLRIEKQGSFVQREREILRRLCIPPEGACPLIIKCFGTAQDDESVYFAFQPCLGGDFCSVLKKKRRLPLPTVRYYMAEVVASLEYLHSKDIIYRDLKPENVLITLTGHAQLCDFGIAYHTTDRSFTFCGTPEYIAPEVLLNKGAGKGVDVWGVGIMIYELLTGLPPWQGDGDEDDSGLAKLFDNIRGGEVKWTAKIDAPSRDFIAALLAINEEDRIGCLCSEGITALKNHAWFSGVDWATVGAVDDRGELLGTGPYKPKKVRASNLSANFVVDPVDSGEEEEEMEMQLQEEAEATKMFANDPDFFSAF